jgi:hypothetical protein
VPGVDADPQSHQEGIIVEHSTGATGSRWTSFVARLQAARGRSTEGRSSTLPVAPRHYEHRHLNTWGDDGAAGTASFVQRVDAMFADLMEGTAPDVITLNEVRPEQVESWQARLVPAGYDVVLAAAGNLVAIPHGSPVRKAQTKYLPSSIQGHGRKEALGMVRAQLNGHWEHIFVAHLEYRDGGRFDEIRVEQARWIAAQARRWAVTFVLNSWPTHTTIGIDENSRAWTRDRAFVPAGFSPAVKSGIDAIYGNLPTLNARTIATRSDHPIVCVTYGKPL